MDRRRFIANSAVALGYVAPSGAATPDTDPAAAPRTPDAAALPGRPVRVASIGFTPGLPLDQIAALVDQEGARGADLIALPETCRGQNDHTPEPLDGPTVSTIARLAAKHRTYIVCPIDRLDGPRRFNSAVLLDRRGRIAAIYDKLYPFGPELDKHPSVLPGQSVKVVSTDFGRLGLAICFDVNWAPLWQRLSDFSAELVVWPSAYSAGRTLQARAIDFNYYIVSSTWVPDCLAFDIDGQQLLHDHQNRAPANVSRLTVDLDRCLFHQDFNLPDKLATLLHDHGADLERERWLPMEGWFILKAKRAGVSARQLARQYGLEERRPYINRARCDLDKARGWQFS